jgi:hypothetical protein
MRQHAVVCRNSSPVGENVLIGTDRNGAFAIISRIDVTHPEATEFEFPQNGTI